MGNKVGIRAMELERLMPQAMAALFGPCPDDDPLRHLSVSQIRLMRVLVEGSTSAGELSRRMDLSASSLTQMVNRLAAQGFVAKETDSEDRRVRNIALSAEGRLAMQTRQQMRASEAERRLAQLPDGQAEKLIELLREISQCSEVKVN